jgi:hypothetical protein
MGRVSHLSQKRIIQAPQQRATADAITFRLFFGGAWLTLTRVGDFKYASNPYAGPPPLLTRLFYGGLGIVLGAVAGFLKRNR